MCVFASWPSHLLCTGLMMFIKRCCTVFRTSFSLSSFFIVATWISISRWENPASWLLPSFCDRTPLSSRTTFACMWSLLISCRRTHCCVTSESLPFAAWNFARDSFNLIHSTYVVSKRSIFLTLFLQILAVLISLEASWQTRLNYSCMNNQVVQWIPCSFGTSTRTLCWLFDVVNNLWRQVLRCFWAEAFGYPWQIFDLPEKASSRLARLFPWPLLLPTTASRPVRQGPMLSAQCLNAIY